MKMRLMLIFSLLCCCLTFKAFAVDSPLTMLKTTSQEIVEKLKANKELKNKPEFIQQIVNQILVPHFDLTMMSRMVISRDVWDSATDKQRKEFKNAFKTLLIRTYSTALSSYNDQTVEFYPIRGGIEGRDQVDVNSKVLRREGPPIPISYRLKFINNEWKVYDFSVDGVSMLESFRSQFSDQLNQGGMTYLLQKLKEHNDKKGNTE